MQKSEGMSDGAFVILIGSAAAEEMGDIVGLRQKYSANSSRLSLFTPFMRRRGSVLGFLVIPFSMSCSAGIARLAGDNAFRAEFSGRVFLRSVDAQSL